MEHAKDAARRLFSESIKAKQDFMADRANLDAIDSRRRR